MANLLQTKKTIGYSREKELRTIDELGRYIRNDAKRMWCQNCKRYPAENESPMKSDDTYAFDLNLIKNIYAILAVISLSWMFVILFSQTDSLTSPSLYGIFFNFLIYSSIYYMITNKDQPLIRGFGPPASRDAINPSMGA